MARLHLALAPKKLFPYLVSKISAFVPEARTPTEQTYTFCRFYSVNLFSEKARITLPHKIVQKHTKLKLKQASAKHKEKRNYKGPVEISCHRSKYNHHKGQTYSNFNPEHLASRGWKNRQSSADYFTLNPSSRNQALVLCDEVADIQSFADLGLESSIVEALKVYNIKKPTNIQALTIPKALQGENALCAAETGSGKSLAFLLPVLNRLLMSKTSLSVGNDHSKPNQPFALVLSPSRELAEQLNAVCTDLANHLDFTNHVVCGGQRTQRLLRSPPEVQMDILVATPGVLSKILTNRIYDMSRLSAVVLDEVDTLLDDSFSAITRRILNKLCYATSASFHQLSDENKVRRERGSSSTTSLPSLHNNGLQLLMAAATMPLGLDEIFGNFVARDRIHKITTSHLNRLLTHVPQKFCRVAGSHKPELLLKHLKQTTQSQTPTLVFCNKLDTILFLQHLLKDNNVHFQSLHGSMPGEVRKGRFEQFQRGEVDVLLCTDIASRGLDTIRAQHVVNYEFPDFISDYIHRVGRVGRVGSEGTGFVLSYIAKPWEVELLWEIEAAARRNTELQNVNANIKRKLKDLHTDVLQLPS